MEVKGQLINSSSYSSSEALQRDLCPRVRLERVQELVEKQRALQQVLSLRLKELRRVCLQEAELTGTLPPEYPLEPGERPQPVRRRVVSAYRIPPALKNEEVPSLEELARELALQQQMAEAARRLAMAPELTAEQRRRRRQVQADAAQRLRELEVQVAECRMRLGKGPLQRVSHEEAFHSESSSLSESASHENDDPHSVHSSKVSNHQGTFSDRSSPPKARDHLRAISSSPDRRPGWRLLQPDLYNETKDRRNSLASPTSPNRTLPRSVSSFEGRSVPATPVLARNACSGSHQFRSETQALHPRQWSGSHDSQLGPPSRDTSADRASLFAARTRRSNSSEALIERAPSEDPLLPSGPPFKSAETLNPSVSGRNPRPLTTTSSWTITLSAGAGEVAAATGSISHAGMGLPSWSGGAFLRAHCHVEPGQLPALSPVAPSCLPSPERLDMPLRWPPTTTSIKHWPWRDSGTGTCAMLESVNGGHQRDGVHLSLSTSLCAATMKWHLLILRWATTVGQVVCPTRSAMPGSLCMAGLLGSCFTWMTLLTLTAWTPQSTQLQAPWSDPCFSPQGELEFCFFSFLFLLAGASFLCVLYPMLRGWGLPAGRVCMYVCVCV
ncbi:hypothetical protein JRQ81_003679 [Phrynocephalus forsythii]|uniref:Cytohesin Ubiquitin Protein Inducing domain-containing protein n=1 Tax=Phrynocephalus forsythii TaxID=171643 RepID=A0A9Q0XNH2_9SAUR|nr:hypothetical protein JRQ81_003679 [Phrynocephalus forsythii]